MPSRRQTEANDAQTSPFATYLMLQLSPYIVEALMSIEQVDVLKRRIRVADSARRGRSYYEQLRFVVTEENRIERDIKRGEMNALIQRYWTALEMQESPYVATKAWSQSKIYLTIFKLSHLHHPQRSATVKSSDSPPSWRFAMFRQNLQYYLCRPTVEIERDEVIQELKERRRAAQAAKEARKIQKNEMSDLVNAMAQVSPGGEWKKAVKYFTKLHDEVFESYRRDNAVSAKFGRGGYQSIYWAPTIGEVVEKEVVRIEKELARAERRKEWAILEMILSWNELRQQYRDLKEARKGGQCSRI